MRWYIERWVSGCIERVYSEGILRVRIIVEEEEGWCHLVERSPSASEWKEVG